MSDATKSGVAPAHGGDLDGLELRRLLEPMTPAVFLREYWAERPVHIKGQPDKFAGLFDMQRFREAVRRGSELGSRTGFRLNAVKRSRELGNLAFGEGISPDEIDECYAAGVTVCVNNIDVGNRDLDDFCQKIKRQMNYLGRVRFNCYYSPDGSGADLHFDARVATTLQVEGKKRWRFAERAAVTWPPSNGQARDGRGVWMGPQLTAEPWEQLGPVDAASFREVVLEPGDVLCLPAGTWHDVKAVGSSLALNLAFEPFDFYGFLVRLLDVTFRSHATWRGGLPPVDVATLGARGLPREVRDYLASRLDELRGFLGAVDLDGPEVLNLWRRLAGQSSG